MRTAAALAFGVLPAVGLVATVPVASVLADGGLIHADKAGSAQVLADGGIIHADKAGSVHLLAEGGVINADRVALADSAIRPADDGVIMSRD
jgi:hypothetical protein